MVFFYRLSLGNEKGDVCHFSSKEMAVKALVSGLMAESDGDPATVDVKSTVEAIYKELAEAERLNVPYELKITGAPFVLNRVPFLDDAFQEMILATKANEHKLPH